jgi:hypothetical protein
MQGEMDEAVVRLPRIPSNAADELQVGLSRLSYNWIRLSIAKRSPNANTR